MIEVITSFLYYSLLLVVGSVIILCLCFYIFQDKIIYQPNSMSENLRTPNLNPEGFRNPAERGIQYEDIYITTSDSLSIHSWLMKRPEPCAPLLIFFHGNSGNLGFRLELLEKIYKEVKVSILAVSYRGYGFSNGKPSEQGLYNDAEAIIKYSLDSGLGKNQLFIYGESLGGSLAIYTAQKFKEIKGIAIENTFTSIPDFIKHTMPKLFFLTKILLYNNWSSIGKISQLNCKILFIAGKKDEVVPHDHMLKLYEAAHTIKDIVIFT